MTKFIIVMLALALSGCVNDFDTVCDAFDDLSKQPNLSKLSTQKRDQFILDRIKSLRDRADAKVAWIAVRNVVPNSERYPMFKESAKASLGRTWSCNSMVDLAASTYPESLPADQTTLPPNVTTMENAEF